MDFGLVLLIQAGGVTLDRLCRELSAGVVAAEEAAFDSVFLARVPQANGGAQVSPDFSPFPAPDAV